MKNHILNGIMGLCVADALGVPVEFQRRDTLKRNPVEGMRSFGTHGQPAGTWSDDTSLTLALMDGLHQSIEKGKTHTIDYHIVMKNFNLWLREARFTPHGEVFDVGNATRDALIRYQQGVSPLVCGGTSEKDNGNGSLMRILPVAFYIHSMHGADETKYADAMDLVHRVSSLTHAHKRSLIACGIYVSIACEILNGKSLLLSIQQGVARAIDYYRALEKEQHFDLSSELSHFKRLLDIENFATLRVDSIRSAGYVVDTLEASIWCLCNTTRYRDCIIRAVNLGEDTDTVAAVAGGLAGLYYGLTSIPTEWVDQIVKREYIEGLCNALHDVLYAATD